MKATDDLYQLVKSLTMSEKRYFKVFSKRHVQQGEVNRYEILFDVFDAQPDGEPYDEEAVKKAIPDKKISKNFADEKKNLTEMVMRAMKTYNAGKSIDSQLYELLSEIDFYRDKRLNQLRRKAIEKAKDLAETYERYPILLTLIERQDALRLELDQDTLREQAERSGLERAAVLELMKTIALLKDKSEWIFLQYRIHAGSVPQEFWDMADRRIFDATVKCYEPGLCFAADSCYYSIWYLYYLLKKDDERLNHYASLIFDLFEIHYPHLKISNPLQYRISLYNYLGGLNSIKDFDKMKTLLDTAEQMQASNEDEAGEDFQNIALYKQLYYMGISQYQAAVDMAEWIHAGIKKHRRKVNKARELILLNNLSLAYMMCGSWDDVADYTERVICDKSDARIDLRYQARLNQLIARYELGQHDTLSYQIRNTQRWVESRNGLSENYNNCLKLLNTLIKEGKPYLKKLQGSMPGKLAEYKGCIAIQIWLYSRVMNVSLVEASKVLEAEEG